MGILSIEPHKELDLDRMMANVGFVRHRDYRIGYDHIIIYRWIHDRTYGLSISCKFCCGGGHNLLKQIVMRAQPDFESCFNASPAIMIEGQGALDKIRKYVLKQTDGIIDIFKEL